MPRVKARVDIEREVCRGIAYRIRRASNNFRKSGTIELGEEEAKLLSTERSPSVLALAVISEVMSLPESDQEKIIDGIKEKRLHLVIYTKKLRIHWLRTSSSRSD